MASTYGAAGCWASGDGCLLFGMKRVHHLARGFVAAVLLITLSGHTSRARTYPAFM
jgi:hypothetical protein